MSINQPPNSLSNRLSLSSSCLTKVNWHDKYVDYSDSLEKLYDYPKLILFLLVKMTVVE